jgi:hypothetical protein
LNKAARYFKLVADQESGPLAGGLFHLAAGGHFAPVVFHLRSRRAMKGRAVLSLQRAFLSINRETPHLGKVIPK